MICLFVFSHFTFGTFEDTKTLLHCLLYNVCVLGTPRNCGFCIDTQKILVYEACLLFYVGPLFYPFLPSWDSRKKKPCSSSSSFFCFQVSAGFGQLLLTYFPFPASFHPNFFFSFFRQPHMLYLFDKVVQKRLNCSSSMPFPCWYCLLLLSVIIICTKAFHKSTHSLGSLHIPLFYLILLRWFCSFLVFFLPSFPFCSSQKNLNQLHSYKYNIPLWIDSLAWYIIVCFVKQLITISIFLFQG